MRKEKRLKKRPIVRRWTTGPKVTQDEIYDRRRSGDKFMKEKRSVYEIKRGYLFILCWVS